MLESLIAINHIKSIHMIHDKNKSITKSIKKTFKNQNNSDIVNFPVPFRHQYLRAGDNQEIINASIWAFRILFKILNDVSYSQFQPNRQVKELSIFDVEFMSDDYSYALFDFHLEEINGLHQNKDIERGIEFLSNYKRGWYKSKNKEGKTVKNYGGLISEAKITNNRLTFLVNGYWLKRILELPSYNRALFEIPWKLSNAKQVLFYLWILELDKTKINWEKMQDVYDTNYKSKSNFIQKFLKPIKIKLDKYGNKSFNYKTKKDIIYITTYLTKAENIQLNINKMTFDKQKVNQKINYWKKRHKLTDEQVNVIKSMVSIDYQNFILFENAYDIFIKDLRKKTKNATDYIGEEFMILFQKIIISAYKDTVRGRVAKNSYPVIIKSK